MKTEKTTTNLKTGIKYHTTVDRQPNSTRTTVVKRTPGMFWDTKKTIVDRRVDRRTK